MPLAPANNCRHTSGAVLPTPHTSPRPVMTTRGSLATCRLSSFFSMYSTASLTVLIFSASSSGISRSKASSNCITSSTTSSESAPRSSWKLAPGVTSASSTCNCSTMICLTFSSTAMRDSPHNFGTLESSGARPLQVPLVYNTGSSGREHNCRSEKNAQVPETSSLPGGLGRVKAGKRDQGRGNGKLAEIR